MPRVTVGVDAGGTSTIAAVAYDGTVVRTHRGRAANATSCGVEHAADAIAQTILEALDGALPEAIFVGAAGAGRPSVASQIEEALRGRFNGSRVRVGDDAVIALRSTVPAGDGAVLVAGTGSIAYAEKGDAAFRSGGYGFLLGDPGSGFAIGCAALKVALHAFEGSGKCSSFVDAVAGACGAKTGPELLEAIYRSDDAVAGVASLAPLTLDFADNGDREAEKIVQNAALDLAGLAKRVIELAQLQRSPLVLAGGLLLQNSLLTLLLETRLENDLPQVPILRSLQEPWSGALRAAEQLIR